MTANLYDIQYTTPSPQEKLQAMLQQILKRKKSISPNPADGFYSEQGKALTDAEGDGVNTTVAPGAAAGQQ